MYIINSNDSQYLIGNSLSSLPPLSSSTQSSSLISFNGNCTTEVSPPTITNTFPNAFIIILILSILCFLGVCFMIFGPLQRSEAHKRIENYTFGRNPIFNVDHRKQSTVTRYDESMEFSL